MIEIAICVVLAGSLSLVLLRGLQVLAKVRGQLRRQKAFTVQEAEVWITCAQKLQALDAPKHTSTRG